MPSSLAVNPDARAGLTIEQLSRAFKGQIERPRTSPLYLIGLALVPTEQLLDQQGQVRQGWTMSAGL